jgi:hypothetical protein
MIAAVYARKSTDQLVADEQKSVTRQATWDERMTARAPQAPRLEPLEVVWRLQGRSGRVLDCGVYRTDAGLEVRCGYGEHDLLRSQYAVEIGTAREIPEE